MLPKVNPAMTRVWQQLKERYGNHLGVELGKQFANKSLPVRQDDKQSTSHVSAASGLDDASKAITNTSGGKTVQDNSRESKTANNLTVNLQGGIYPLP